MEEQDDLKKFLVFQLNRNIISLYKKYFEIIDDLKIEHRTMLEKIKQQSSEEFVKNIDYFNADKYNHIRKKILDAGNDVVRNVESNFDSVKITLK